jgi:hypothetical protein
MEGKMIIGHGTTINDLPKIPKERNPIYGMEYPFPPKGKKYDDNKPMLAQFYKHFSNAYHALVDVATYGFKKYNEDLTDPNWKKVSIERYEDALFRHFSAYLTGDKIDKESGKSHLAHLIWNACVLYELNEVKNENT